MLGEDCLIPSFRGQARRRLTSELIPPLLWSQGSALVRIYCTQGPSGYEIESLSYMFSLTSASGPLWKIGQDIRESRKQLAGETSDAFLPYSAHRFVGTHE